MSPGLRQGLEPRECHPLSGALCTVIIPDPAVTSKAQEDEGARAFGYLPKGPDTMT